MLGILHPCLAPDFSEMPLMFPHYDAGFKTDGIPNIELWLNSWNKPQLVVLCFSMYEFCLKIIY